MKARSSSAVSLFVLALGTATLSACGGGGGGGSEATSAVAATPAPAASTSTSNGSSTSSTSTTSGGNTVVTHGGSPAAVTAPPAADSPSATAPVATPPNASPPAGSPTPTRLADNTAIPSGGGAAGSTGVISSLFQVPLVPIHVVSLLDGRVMFYGATTAGYQGGQLEYAIWDPAVGTGPGAFMVLPNTTGTDLFCSTQVLLPGGRVLTAGGDQTFQGVRNFADDQVTVFDPSSNWLSLEPQRMRSPRWYATSVALADGRVAVFGGRNSKPTSLKDPNTVNPDEVATMPEVWDGTNWRWLSGADSNAAFGWSVSENWSYPRVFAGPDGHVFAMNNEGQMFDVDPSGQGAIRTFRTRVGTTSRTSFPAVMFAPGKILTARDDLKTAVITLDAGGGEPTVTYTGDRPKMSSWGEFVVLPDGQVLNSNGSIFAENDNGSVPNEEQANKGFHLWNPQTGQWRTTGVRQARFRLYHSNIQLLDDATLFISGGGLPGPETNMTGEIYYPPYLYRADGSRAHRPEVQGVPAVAGFGQTLSLSVRSEAGIAAVNLMRFGGSTHSLATDQRFIPLALSGNTGDAVRVTLPDDPRLMVPGNYRLFVIDGHGVPSVAAKFTVFPG